MTESSVTPLLRSFAYGLWRILFGYLLEELLLCPVRAFRLYLSCTASISLRPRSLFVSPRPPSRALSKNALGFFLRDLISCASSSSASAGGSSSSSAPSSSAFRARSVRSVAASWPFSLIASLFYP